MSRIPATMGTLIRGDLPKGCLVYDVPFVVKVLVVIGFFVAVVVVVVEVLVDDLVVGFLVVDGALDVVVVVDLVEITIGVQHSPRTDSPIEVQV